MFDEVHLTGFKKFGDVKVNPTELIVDELLAHPIPNVFPSKLDVTTSDVDGYIQSKSQQLHDTKKCILNLHLGVGHKHRYALESCGYNNKDFGIPDNSGQTFSKAKISNDRDLDEPINCKLDLHALHASLKGQFAVKVSSDPGRYLCNYIYFCSLERLCRESQQVESLFVHFPPETTHEQNMAFVKTLLGYLKK